MTELSQTPPAPLYLDDSAFYPLLRAYNRDQCWRSAFAVGWRSAGEFNLVRYLHPLFVKRWADFSSKHVERKLLWGLP